MCKIFKVDFYGSCCRQFDALMRVNPLLAIHIYICMYACISNPHCMKSCEMNNYLVKKVTKLIANISE